MEKTSELHKESLLYNSLEEYLISQVNPSFKYTKSEADKILEEISHFGVDISVFIPSNITYRRKEDILINGKELIKHILLANKKNYEIRDVIKKAKRNFKIFNVENNIIKKAETAIYNLKGMDSLNLYLKEIGRIPVLARDEEGELAKRKDEGDDEARKKLIYHNLKFVVQLVIPYLKYLRSNADFLDIIQEGNTGLITGVEKYDHKKGYRVTTYVSWWIRRLIIKYIDRQFHIIKRPSKLIEKSNKLKKTADALKRKYGFVDEKELIALSGISMKEIKKIEDMNKIKSKSLDEVLEDSETTLMSITGDENTYSPEDEFLAKSLRDDINNILSTKLSPMESTVIKMGFGLDDGHKKTLKKIGSKINVTAERARQIRIKGFKKIASDPARREMLREYLTEY